MHIHEGYHLRELGDDHLVIGLGEGQKSGSRRVVRLNESAAFLWRAVAKRDFSLADLASLLREEYDLAEAAALSDAESIADAWKKAGLVDE